MLTFNLKKEWYEKIRSGKKRKEYREVKPYWNKRIRNELVKYFKCDKNHPFFLQWNRMHNTWDDGEGISTHCVGRDVHAPLECRFVLGYTKRYMTAIITRIEVVDGKYTDLVIDKPVYAIHFIDVREMVQCPHCKGNGAMLGDGLGVMECPWCGGDGEWESEDGGEKMEAELQK